MKSRNIAAIFKTGGFFMAETFAAQLINRCHMNALPFQAQHNEHEGIHQIPERQRDWYEFRKREKFAGDQEHRSCNISAVSIIPLTVGMPQSVHFGRTGC